MLLLHEGKVVDCGEPASLENKTKKLTEHQETDA